MKQLKYIFEFLVILLITIGLNLNKITPKYSYLGIIGASVFLLIWFSIVLTSEDKFKFARFGYSLILIRIVTPIISILLTIILYKPNHESLETENLVVNSRQVDSISCSSIRYGYFKSFDDSILRFRSDGADFEIHNNIDTFEVIWIDSCSYKIQKRGFFEIFRIIEIHENFILLEGMKNDLKREIILLDKID